MNNKEIKALLTAFLCTIGLVITQQASAKIYTYEGVLTRAIRAPEFNIGESFTFILDINGSPVGRSFPSVWNPILFKTEYENIDLNSAVIDFGSGKSISSSDIHASASWGSSILDLNAPTFSNFPEGDNRISIISFTGVNQGWVQDNTFDENIMLGLNTMNIFVGVYTPEPTFLRFYELYGSVSLVNVVPEPSSYALLLSGLGLLFIVKRKKA
jgi:hypothetical protein